VPTVFLGKVQIIMGVLAVLTIPLYLLTYDWMSDVVTLLNKDAEGGYKTFLMFSHVIAMVIMIPTTFCAGMTLPLITHILMKSASGEKSIGRVYSFNTVGAIVGVLFALYIGLPVFGLKGALVIAALIDIGLGCYLLLGRESFQSLRRNIGLVSISLVIVISTVAFVKVDKRLLTSGVFRNGDTNITDGRRIDYYKDGITASISFMTLPDQTGIIITNGKPDAAINLDVDSEVRKRDESTMALLGSLPLAFSSDPQRVANIGFGSGMTTHTLLFDEQLKEVHTVEIEESIIEGAKYFGKAVEKAYNDSRSIIHIDDAKTFFSVNNIEFDIVIAEPSNPWVSGVSSLFTKEFYDNVQRYISDDGIFVQWIQLYEFNDDLLLSILKTINESFPDLAVYSTDSSNLLVVAKKKGKLGLPNWERLLKGEMREELKRHNIFNTSDLDARLIATAESIASLLTQSSTKINSDYYPYLDNFAAEARFKKSASTVLQDIAEAPLPILEVLYSKDVSHQDVTFNSHMQYTSHRKMAKDAISYATTGVVEGGIFNSDMIRAIDSMRYISQTCTNNSFKDVHKIWVQNMSMVFPIILTFSSSEVAEQFIEEMKLDDSCKNGNWPDEIYDLQEFYLLLAKRDHEKLDEVGIKILDSEYVLSQPATDYFRAGVLLSYLATDRLSSAINFKDEYINKSNTFGTATYEILLLGELDRRKAMMK